jgi:hypothetical protein
LGEYQALRKNFKREITACNQELHLLKLVSGVRTEEQVAAGRERAALLRRRLHKAQEQLVSLSTVPTSQGREEESNETGGGKAETDGEAEGEEGGEEGGMEGGKEGLRGKGPRQDTDVPMERKPRRKAAASPSLAPKESPQQELTFPATPPPTPPPLPSVHPPVTDTRRQKKNLLEPEEGQLGTPSVGKMEGTSPSLGSGASVPVISVGVGGMPRGAADRAGRNPRPGHQSFFLGGILSPRSLSPAPAAQATGRIASLPFLPQRSPGSLHRLVAHSPRAASPPFPLPTALPPSPGFGARRISLLSPWVECTDSSRFDKCGERLRSLCASPRPSCPLTRLLLHLLGRDQRAIPPAIPR